METTGQMTDGSWPEGMTYQTYGFNALTPLLRQRRHPVEIGVVDHGDIARGELVHTHNLESLYLRTHARGEA